MKIAWLCNTGQPCSFFVQQQIVARIPPVNGLQTVINLHKLNQFKSLFFSTNCPTAQCVRNDNRKAILPTHLSTFFSYLTSSIYGLEGGDKTPPSILVKSRKKHFLNTLFSLNSELSHSINERGVLSKNVLSHCPIMKW